MDGGAVEGIEMTGGVDGEDALHMVEPRPITEVEQRPAVHFHEHVGWPVVSPLSAHPPDLEPGSPPKAIDQVDTTTTKRDSLDLTPKLTNDTTSR